MLEDSSGQCQVLKRLLVVGRLIFSGGFWFDFFDIVGLEVLSLFVVWFDQRSSVRTGRYVRRLILGSIIK